ncbi:MAG TPA: hypothetical protein DDW85_02375 [Porphyromonadaceae bacterium]|nr:hypothetical protein [Porphyromonadaceae bacterium]
MNKYMATKKQIERLIRCADCKNSIGEVKNYLIGCSDTKANPAKCLMGNYPRICKYFIKK